MNITRRRPTRRILIVDDTADFLREFSAILCDFYEVRTCMNPQRVKSMLGRGNYDLLISSLVMQKMDGFSLLRQLRGAGFTLPIIIITSYGNENTGTEAFRLGATDYFNRPVSPEVLLASVARALNPVRTSSDATRLLSNDLVMSKVLLQCERVAGTDTRVLIVGETGTGKELIARMLHEKSDRAGQPFVEINCAALPSHLVESELFGHEKGAFTGAVARRAGRFEEAGRGTIFLDEIGELDISLQSKLLRVLESGDYYPVGAEKPRKSLARVIAATNRNLYEETRAGRFRPDLYYRLSVVTLTLPPLRERQSDIPLLLEHFAQKFSRQPGKHIRFSQECQRCLIGYDWPGNVRELQHLVEQLTVLYPGALITPDHLPSVITQRKEAAFNGETTHALNYHEALQRFQLRYFSEALHRCKGNMAMAARESGMDRSQFFRKLVSLGLHQAAK